MSLKYLVMGGAALIALIPTATLANEAWTGLNAAPAVAPSAPGAVVFDPAAPRTAEPAAPAAPFVLAPVEPAAPEAPAAGADTQLGEGGVDESALRYYASRNDVARVAAEIRACAPFTRNGSRRRTSSPPRPAPRSTSPRCGRSSAPAASTSCARRSSS